MITRPALSLYPHRDQIDEFMEEYEHETCVPFYHSVDVRDAGWKTTIVDTNLYPGGFNNLDDEADALSPDLFRAVLRRKLPGTHVRNILLFIEEHTRNLWYLENIRRLAAMLEASGTRVTLATLFPVEDSPDGPQELITATGRPITVLPPDLALRSPDYDVIILNHDLMKGPGPLLEVGIPKLPPVSMGWHRRRKYSHFKFYNAIVGELSERIGTDAWLLSSLHDQAEGIDINEEADRDRLATLTEAVLDRIREKYRQHSLTVDPYVYIKSDYGTYGMGVWHVQSGEEVREINRKNRNRLFKGKGARTIDAFLIQEGVPTGLKDEGQVAEPVYYMIGNQLAGRFFRRNSEKDNLGNLNSTGMNFRPFGREALDPERDHLYTTLARLAGLAAQAEMIEADAQEGRSHANCLPD